MATPIRPDEMSEALELGTHELVALVGGGGKTTALLALGRRLPGRVLLTTTTRMGARQTDGTATLSAPTDLQISEALAPAGATVFVRRAVADGKSLGVTPQECDRWFDLADHVVVEADGAAMRPFTAPRPHEPVVPSRTTVLVACIGGDALGRVIADQCHCPMRVAAVAGCSPYQRLTPARAAKVLLDERGSRKSCPPHARFVVMVTKVDTAARPFADELVELVGPAAAVVLVAFDPTAGPDYPPRR
jgi:probable selenium-dependent hydroxylase accessory protein YqeC